MSREMLEIATEAARAAGAIQRERFDTRLEIRHKGIKDLVTDVDLACEEAMREVLAKLAPGTSVLGEEEGRSGSGDLTWIVDPIDGTTNYAHGLPVFCAVVALEEKGEITAGAIFDPMRDELFTAVKGGGAKLNNKPISVTTTKTLDQSLLATGFPYDNRTSERNNFNAFAQMTKASQGVRRLGSAALDLAYTACGRFDGFWELKLKPWDIAAGMLLVREAGGKVTALDGGEYDHYNPDILASNGVIHGEMVEELGKVSSIAKK